MAGTSTQLHSEFEQQQVDQRLQDGDPEGANRMPHRDNGFDDLVHCPKGLLRIFSIALPRIGDIDGDAETAQAFALRVGLNLTARCNPACQAAQVERAEFRFEPPRRVMSFVYESCDPLTVFRMDPLKEVGEGNAKGSVLRVQA
ncbi:hypothetical protein AEGHOMDF_2321 [Methylobacterium soli]|nr:hypothetical protein [Methylobacterium soli]GJE43142.1 hypothetical protein AEGHOMDF_2321 [Methylobacterium soli]